MKKLIKFIKSTALVVPLFAMSFAVMFPTNSASALTAAQCNCGQADQVMTTECGAKCTNVEDESCLFGKDASGNPCLFTKIVNTALFLVGAISVVMLIYGGIRYTLSGGDSTAVGNAKNTILYAIVGIVITVLAYSIVGFVVAQLQ